MIGTQNAHNLVSASTDGTVCAWGVDRLAEPEEVLELLHPAHNKTDEVSVTSLGFPDSDTKTFWVGTEEGNVYAANRHDLGGLKRGLVQTETYRGHSGPVTSIDFHPLAGAVDLSDLFLTSGVDWTVKLWKRGAAGTSTAATEAGAATGLASSAAPTSKSTAAKVVSPILSFEGADDYVYDARWHPHHPALFGTVDGAGKFDLWNLNTDTEIPIISTPVAPNASRGLNKLAWDRREGRRAAIGSSDGKVYVYEVAQELVTPKEGEWEQMRKTVNTALAANASAEMGGR
ncbi:WD40-repeat-containing domain protein [Leucosporidium creatinivorum]|uniref:WD40-repeat-containing domain protein n=1 Tax=Leucosporidium creatinivorum TaxID=106004 RepID=A0A1Y2E418_9BASI|nr:WD40-repeat-containing domain protein [Leucosporidium creatinivorum]